MTLMQVLPRLENATQGQNPASGNSTESAPTVEIALVLSGKSNTSMVLSQLFSGSIRDF